MKQVSRLANDRRPYDDVVDITLRVAEGALCGAIGTCGVQTSDPNNGLPYTDGARAAGPDVADSHVTGEIKAARHDSLEIKIRASATVRTNSMGSSGCESPRGVPFVRVVKTALSRAVDEIDSGDIAVIDWRWRCFRPAYSESKNGNRK